MILPLLLILTLASSDKDFGRTATLTVKSQKNNKLKDQTFNITAASASSQTISANHQLIRVILPTPNHGCSQFGSITDVNISYPIYFLVQGRDGGCTYARKVFWAKKSIAKGVIIIDSPKGINNLRPRKNDNFQTFLMPEDEGDKIIEALQNKDPYFIAQLNIGDQKQLKTGDVEIWISSLNKQSYQMLKWYEMAITDAPILKTNLKWKPRFALVSNIRGGKNDYVASCACSGMFCSPEHHGKTSNILVRQDIRQSLIFKQHPDKFLVYMRTFERKCFDGYLEHLMAEDCAGKVLSMIGIDASDLNQRIDAFLKNCNAEGEPRQIYGQMTLDRTKMRHINKYPTLILNHEQLYVKSAEELKITLCKKMSFNKQKGCSVAIDNQTFLTKVIHGIFWVLLVVGLTVVAAIAVLYYRKKMRKDVNKQLRMQVSTAVQHYYQLSETSETK